MEEKFYELISKKFYASAYLWGVDALGKGVNGNLKEILQSYTTKDWRRYRQKVKRSYRSIDFDKASDQIDFVSKFDADHYANIVVDNNILILKPVKFRRTRNTIVEFLEDPMNVFIGGNSYRSVGVSSIDNIKSIVDQFEDDFEAVAKYSKIATFIGQLTDEIQLKMSEKQIGIIIHDDRLFLLKWVQYIDDTSASADIIEDMGLNIAVEIKEDLSLGELIVFKENDTSNPLFTLDSRMFDNPCTYNLETNSEEFLQDVLSRIETGISLIGEDSIETIEDLDLFINISLQKIDQLEDFRQKIIKLRDLNNLNQNPDNRPIIEEKMEESYIGLLQRTSDITEINTTIQEITRANITPSNILDAIVDVFDTYEFMPSDIISTLEYITSEWRLEDGDYDKLESPQMNAISSIVLSYLGNSDIEGALSYIDQSIQIFPRLNNNSLATLITEVIVRIFSTNVASIRDRFTPHHFFTLLERIQNSDEIEEEVGNTFLMLSNDVKFLSFLNIHVGMFLNRIKHWEAMKQSKKFRIVSSIAKTAPIAGFHDSLPSLNTEVFHFVKEHQTIALQFVARFFEVFSNSHDQLFNDYNLLSESNDLAKEIKEWIEDQHIKDLFLSETKRNIRNLVESWYLYGELPESGFDIHKEFVNTWASFIGYSRQIDQMQSVLYLKDFISSCRNFEMRELQKKYAELPNSVFNLNLSIMINDMLSLMEDRAEDPVQFFVVHQLFVYFQKDYYNFEFTPITFEEVVNRFANYVEKTIDYAVNEGEYTLFEEVFKNINGDLIYIPFTVLSTLRDRVISAYEIELEELDRFVQRIEQMKYYFVAINHVVQKYDDYMDERFEFMHENSFTSLAHFEEIANSQIETAKNMLKSILHYITQLSSKIFFKKRALKNIQTLFNELIEIVGDEEFFVNQFNQFLDDFFYNEEICEVDVKIAIFRQMKDVFDAKNLQSLYNKISRYISYEEKRRMVNRRYEILSTRSKSKTLIREIARDLRDLTEIYSNFPMLWHELATCYLLLGKYEEGIVTCEKAIEYKESLSSIQKVRLYGNYILAFIKSGELDRAREAYDNLPIEIKQNAKIRSLRNSF